ncbi:hypothetical protein LTR36_001272 [Oleoguttula mirabilis]|uniref:DUF7730 domain-containing protein n=1 Tax=Oleoguttula mirabilis TaxID=1507867 RepID=A0AAV9JNB3_9PEZI|nr:hypothetical protein LTR36_001272 [Oleoguttula mirabilis]
MPHELPTLADRFHALPAELREHVFALLLVQPVRYDMQHLGTCPLRDASLPLNANLRPSRPWRTHACGWRRHDDYTPTWHNPWRSKYAPPVRNPFLCSDCWDRKFRPRPFPVVSSDSPCLCARRQDLDVLLVCRRWHAEAGRVFYSRDTFDFEDARTCLAFFAGLRQQWRETVTSVSLVAYQGQQHALIRGAAWESRKAWTRVWCLLRTLPSLSRLALSTHHLEDERTLRPLLRLGPQRPRAICFTERMPAACLLKLLPRDDGSALGGMHYICPSLANRILVRGGLAEQVGRVLKGQLIAWVRLGKRAKLEVLGRAVEWQQENVVEMSLARDFASLGLEMEKGVHVLEGHDLAEWERLWWMVGWQHAFLP